jgi:hypothetical protein
MMGLTFVDANRSAGWRPAADSSVEYPRGFLFVPPAPLRIQGIT